MAVCVLYTVGLVRGSLRLHELLPALCEKGDGLEGKLKREEIVGEE
jgi:hypothetical protein